MSLVGVKAKNHRQQVARRGACDRANTRTTPEAVFWAAEEDYGPFTLDVAAAPDNARCRRFFTIEDDGLTRPWSGRVWCNPPYSAVAAWVAKAHEEAARCAVIVMLVPANRTEQRWWHEYVEPFRDRDSDCVLTTQFLPGRLEFGPPAADGKGNRPPFGCALLIWRKRTSNEVIDE